MYKFNMKFYDWFTECETDRSLGFIGKIKAYFNQRKQCIANGKWHMMKSGYTFIGVIWFASFSLILDLSNFFNKFNLGLPASHWLLGIRIWIIGMFCIMCAKEYYEWLTKCENPRKNQISLSIFINHLILLVETLLYFKHLDKSKYDAEIPTFIQGIWLLILIIIIILAFWLNFDYNKERQILENETKSEISESSHSD